MNDRAYATANGFYMGDKVECKDGRISYIKSIIYKDMLAYIGLNEEPFPASLVELTDNSITLDIWLTRVGDE